jgi:putative membrane protein
MGIKKGGICMMGYGFGGLGMMGGGPFMMVLFLVVIGYLFYLALNKQTPTHKEAYISTYPTVDLEALNIAKARLANGEISIEEFEQIKINLL